MPDAESAKAEVVVEAHPVVRDLKCSLLAHQMVGHIFRVENGLDWRVDIRGAQMPIPSFRVLRPEHGQAIEDLI